MNFFKDKYTLTQKQNLFLAKKKWDENIYCGMKMENRNVTFPQTQTILNGINVPSVTLDDIQAILNMRDAWKYILSSIDHEMNIDYICKINEFVARNESLEWGVLRSGAVGISGTEYTPPIPQKATVERQLKEILNNNTSLTEKAINTFLWGCKTQMFWDGNKRTSLLLANQLLIQNGNGMMIIAEKQMPAFNTLLNYFYNSFIKTPAENETTANKFKKFLYDNTIIGIDF